MMSIMAILMFPKAEQAYVEGFFRGAQGVATLPEWPSMALVVLGAAAMAIQYVLLFFRDILAAVLGTPPVDHKNEQFVE